ncbi:hypothetical protein [Brevibacillus daliensis]|uniref:hypothetical protein n=1 Tax=Brevibacillus daliensis TaxID=2892995 RepID=UPI001E4BCFEF|nr:hypothetical protein [Brevibacillus daliensis]
MKTQYGEVIVSDKATYSDLFLRKNPRMRILETIVFIVAIILLSLLFEDRNSALFKVVAVGSAVVLLGLTPIIYKAVLNPHYTLTKTHLIITIRGVETAFHLTQVEPILEGRHLYRLNGKRASLMINRKFLTELNQQIQLIQKKNKRR